jgi:hypothetical protein
MGRSIDLIVDDDVNGVFILHLFSLQKFAFGRWSNEMQNQNLVPLHETPDGWTDGSFESLPFQLISLREQKYFVL